ncbi:MAG: sulfatase/phosphatase domain-containing protein, partial [Verrucomicrobiota bacterium]|nr:sulfatase/phosphatase domain-containing protein [Verrucomicrobiota bacterium]
AHRNTMIWFCSDNGPEGNESAPGKTGGFRGRKRSLYEGGVRVPALLEWPEKITKNDKITCPAGTIDYLPTILSLLDIQLPDQRPIDGINLIPIITKKGKSRGKSIGFQSNSVASLITDRYKIILKKKNNTVELYDILNDPFEKNDIALSMVDKASELKAELNKWIASCSESDQGKDYPKNTGQ